MNSTTARIYGMFLHRNLYPVCHNYCESGVSEWLCRAVSKKSNVTVLLLVTEGCGEFNATLYKILHRELQ